MSWSRMRFKGQEVWVRVDPAGRPLLDGEGRAEMKYRQEDERSYRPAPQNLEPAGTGASGPTSDARRPGAGPAARRTGSGAGPPRKPAARPQRAGALGPAGPEVIHVWTDGACTGNPGPMGLGVVVLADGAREELSEYLGVGTNNIAELTAIARGVEIAERLDPTRGRPVRVYSDSAYAIGVVSLGWKAKANQELVARLRQLVGRFSSLTFVKVAGHAGIPENERCDELARRAIETRGRT